MNVKTATWTPVLLLVTSMALSGCAALMKKRAADTEQLLSAAGFVPRQPRTPEDLEKLEKAQPLVIARATKDGKTIYVYPDPYNCKCVYVGSEEQYREFRRISGDSRLGYGAPDAERAWESGPPSGHDNFW